MGYLACFAFGGAIAGGLYWLTSRAIYRGSWSWLDRMNETGVKWLVIGCIAMAIAWALAFAAFMVRRS